MCVHNNSSVININYGRLQDLIFPLKIPMGSRKKQSFVNILCVFVIVTF